MVAATVFFLMESINVGYHWKTSMNVGALVTLVAAVHYFYMREFWTSLQCNPVSAPASSGDCCLAPLLCWLLGMPVSPKPSILWQASVPACVDGASSCLRSSRVKLEVSLHLVRR